MGVGVGGWEVGGWEGGRGGGGKEEKEEVWNVDGASDAFRICTSQMYSRGASFVL